MLLQNSTRISQRYGMVLILALLVAFGLQRSTTTNAQGRKPVFVIFHGIRNASADMEEIRQAVAETGLFSKVVAVDYEWKTDTVPNVAPRLFKQLNDTYPGADFAFYGYSKGGLVAEWITERVKLADGRIKLLITVSSPLDGADNLTKLYDAATAGLNPFRNEDRTTLEKKWPGIEELRTGSRTIENLRNEPLNDLSNTNVIRVYGKNDRVVEQDSALREPSGEARSLRKVIIRSPANLADHRAMRTYLANYKKLLRRILSNDLPPESSYEPIELADEKVFSTRYIPEGWVPCTCPGQHSGLGIWFGDTLYHDPTYFCR